jgi:nucleotide-binding universal stress UspA family protein
VLNGSVREAVDPDAPVKVSSTVHEGNAAQVLLDASEGADLLVVGSRGHGGFTAKHSWARLARPGTRAAKSATAGPPGRVIRPRATAA